ncbi:MORN repeat-containing protein [Haloplasma contractile]|uniref:Uncharacterized protein n=1 Tax=Haloplasma contractile SSD-17B TaxID=1033810 RepID=F7Q1Q4_9MOLU|nr:MORN repeat-containing protein [Haloplasma contractile]ERJ12283.1 hypothetical protein HLPCO_001810 [Haloplasma contractile SSD-17B]
MKIYSSKITWLIVNMILVIVLSPLILFIFHYEEIKYIFKLDKLDNLRFALNYLSVILTSILSLFIVKVNYDNFRKRNNDYFYEMREYAFVLIYEIEHIYNELLPFLKYTNNKQTKNSDNFYRKFHVSKNWRNNISKFSGVIPKESIQSLFELYTKIEKIQNNEMRFTAKQIINDFIKYIEINNIEYFSNGDNPVLMADVRIKLMYLILKDIINCKKIKPVNSNKMTKKDDRLYYSMDINRIYELKITETTVNNIFITSCYKNNKIIEQKASIDNKIIRDCKYDKEGYIKGYDKYSIDNNQIYSRLYRKKKLLLPNYTFYFDRDKFIYEGNFVDGKLNGKGRMYYNDELISEGEYSEGILINGYLYNVEKHRIYKSSDEQENYNYNKMVSSREYIERQAEEQEHMNEEYLEEQVKYESILVDYKLENREKTKVNEKIKKIYEFETSDTNSVSPTERTDMDN